MYPWSDHLKWSTTLQLDLDFLFNGDWEELVDSCMYYHEASIIDKCSVANVLSRNSYIEYLLVLRCLEAC